jgi:hypothetical protein
MCCESKSEEGRIYKYLGYSNPKSFVNLLLPPQGIGEGWGGVKNLRLLQELLYEVSILVNPLLKNVRSHPLLLPIFS